MQKIVFIVVLCMAIIAAGVWGTYFPDLMRCQRANNVPDSKCLADFIMLSPPVQDTLALRDACNPNNSSDLSCELRVAQKIAEEKLSE